MDDGVYVLDTEGRTTFANEAAVRLLGYSLREMLGRAQHALIHYQYADGSHFPVEDCPIFHSVRDGVSQRVGSDTFWRKDGTPLLVDYTSTPVKHGREMMGAVITFREATERRLTREQAEQIEREREANAERDRALAEARAARDLLNDVFENVPAAVSMTRGPEHTMVLANAMARQLTGNQDLIGKTVVEALPHLEGSAAVAPFDQVYSTGAPVRALGVTVELDPDGTGELRPMQFDIAYLPVRDADGQVTGVLTFSTESTSRVVEGRPAD